MSYLIVFFVLSLMIALHEWGHLLAAKFAGIPIARFSVGFGRKLWGFQRGETEYRISAIPCGGYVLPAVEHERAMEQFPLRHRILFLLGGPIANVLGAFISLATLNAIQHGLSIHSVAILPVEQLSKMALHILTVIPTLFSQPDQFSGIVGVVAAGGAHVGLSFTRLLEFSVLLNLNLAIFNLLPILPLDGGKIMMGVLQKLYQPLRRLELPLTIGGTVLLLGMMLGATVLDIARLTH